MSLHYNPKGILSTITDSNKWDDDNYMSDHPYTAPTFDADSWRQYVYLNEKWGVDPIHANSY